MCVYSAKAGSRSRTIVTHRGRRSTGQVEGACGGLRGDVGFAVAELGLGLVGQKHGLGLRAGGGQQSNALVHEPVGLAALTEIGEATAAVRSQVGRVVTDFARPDRALDEIASYAHRRGVGAVLTVNEYLTELAAHPAPSRAWPATIRAGRGRRSPMSPSVSPQEGPKDPVSSAA